jgi:hypothetical protein
MDGLNDGLHPRHPGRGCSTALIAAEGDKSERGGFFVFLPSGATRVVSWTAVQPITPTLEASKKYAAEVIESLLKAGLQTDVDATNWASVTAAIQRIILDWNSSLKGRIGAEMVRRFH